jgi:hypothetical protein
MKPEKYIFKGILIMLLLSGRLILGGILIHYTEIRITTY